MLCFPPWLLLFRAGYALSLHNSIKWHIEEEDIVESAETPNPRVSLPYIYLLTWFISHCSCLMNAPAPRQRGQETPFLQRLERCSWKYNYLTEIRQVLSHFSKYEFFRSFPYFSNGGYGDSFMDVWTDDNFSVLFLDSFRWLVSIRPSYHIYHLGSICYIDPYFLYRFTRQFEYDQLYIGNPSSSLNYEDSLIDGVRGWYWHQVGCTGAQFQLPAKTLYLRYTRLLQMVQEC